MNLIIEGTYLDVLKHWSYEYIDELFSDQNLIQTGRMKIIHLPNAMKNTLHLLREIKRGISENGVIQ